VSKETYYSVKETYYAMPKTLHLCSAGALTSGAAKISSTKYY
jgi:hypothetical protein